MFNCFRLLTYSDLSVCLALARGERERERDSISREELAHRFVAFTRSDTDNNKREKEGGGEFRSVSKVSNFLIRRGTVVVRGGKGVVWMQAANGKHSESRNGEWRG